MKSQFTFLKNQLKARDKKNSWRILISMGMTQRKYLRQSLTSLIVPANWKNSSLFIEWMLMGTLCVSERLEKSWLWRRISHLAKWRKWILVLYSLCLRHILHGLTCKTQVQPSSNSWKMHAHVMVMTMVKMILMWTHPFSTLMNTTWVCSNWGVLVSYIATAKRLRKHLSSMTCYKMITSHQLLQGIKILSQTSLLSWIWPQRWFSDWNQSTWRQESHSRKYRRKRWIK